MDFPEDEYFLFYRYLNSSRTTIHTVGLGRFDTKEKAEAEIKEIENEKEFSDITWVLMKGAEVKRSK
jgi:hypothetical protein